MNHIYRLIWCAERQTWMVAHEGANARGKPASAKKRLLSAISAALIMPFTGAALGAPPAANALPTSGQVVSGQASISQAGANMTINQTTNKAILNWQSFNIGANASVHFQQPGASAVALNRVIGSDPSAIYGSLTATGQVFLVNPSGVLFGPGARVDVGGLVATTLNIRDDDFLKGSYVFRRDGAAGSVVNQGSVNAKYVAMLAPEVRNEGVISARMGTAALAAGGGITLGITGDKLIDVQVTQAQFDTLVENKHLVQADGGTVILAAQSANALLGSVVNSGAIEARGIVSDGGVVRLLASTSVAHSGSINVDAAQSAGSAGKGGTAILLANLDNAASRTSVSGSISARGGDGGFIETSASRLSIADTARINTSAAAGKAGEWLLDPTDFTVAATGGDITGAALASALGTGNVTIQTGTGTNTASDKFGASGTNGDVFVNDTVSWSANTLTLKAHRDVNVNAAMSATGSAGLAVEYGQGAVASGNDAWFTVNAPVNLNTTGSFSTKQGSDGTTKNYTIVNNLTALQAIDASGTSVQGNYALGSNLTISSGNWTPIGNTNGPFQGIFEGLGHSVSGITNAASVTDNVGFFGQTDSNARVQNVRVDVALTGRTAVGGLVGNNQGTIYNAFSTGSVGVDAAVGTSVVQQIGGLVGQNIGNVVRSRSSVNVTATTGEQSAGVLPGAAGDGGIGGLVGASTGGKVSNSYATGNVSGIRNVGGLVGNVAAPIENSYSNGVVTGSNTGSGTGAVANVGGLTGFIPVGIVVSDSYWDTTTSGQATSAGAEAGLTTANLQVAANISNAWDRTRFWKITDGSNPQFISAVAATSSSITINLGDFSRVYGTAPDVGNLTGFSFTGSLLGADVLNATAWGTAYTSTLGVGNYNYQTTANLLAPQFTFTGGRTAANYTLSYSNNKLSITPKALGFSTNTTLVGKIYDGNNTGATFNVGTLSGLVGTETLGVTAATTTYSSKDAGTRTATAAYALADGAGVGGGLASNYTLADTIGLSAAITPKTLGFSTNTTLVGKIYDGNNTGATFNVGTLSGLVGAETLGVTAATTTYSSKDAGARIATAAYALADGAGVGGGLAGNYTLADTIGLSAVITPKALTINGTTLVGKTYDGSNTGATFNIGTLIGFVGTETLGVTAAATTYSSKDAGARTATAAYALADGAGVGGGLAGNYTLAATTGLSATISKKALSISGNSASGRAYDGTTVAAITTGTLSGFVGTEIVSATATGTFDSKDAGARTATAAYALADGAGVGGGLAGNYTLANTIGLTATITPKALTVTGLFAPTSKVYDATTAASVSGTPALLAPQAPGAGTTADGKAYTGDVVAINGTATGTYNTKDVVTANLVTFGGLSSSNSNYTISAKQNATITPKALAAIDLGLVYQAIGKEVYAVDESVQVYVSNVPRNSAPGAGLSGDGLAYTGDFKTGDYTAKVTGLITTSNGMQNVYRVSIPSSAALTGNDASNYTLSGNSVTAQIQASALPFVRAIPTASIINVIAGQTASGAGAVVSGSTPVVPNSVVDVFKNDKPPIGEVKSSLISDTGNAELQVTSSLKSFGWDNTQDFVADLSKPLPTLTLPTQVQVRPTQRPLSIE